MSEIIRAPCFSGLNTLETTHLDADVFPGATTATILSALGYPSNIFILLGNPGIENAEVLTLSSAAGKVFNFTSQVQNIHYRMEQVVRLFGDQVRLYRAANVDGTVPDDASFTYIASGAIQGDDLTVDIADTTGGSGYWYKTSFYNSLTLDETSLSMSVAVLGGNLGKLVSIQSIRFEAGLTDNTQISDSRIAEIRDTAESEVLGKLSAGGYLIPLQTSSGAPFIPPVVEKIARLLSAGDLLAQEFPGSEADSKNGAKKIKDARDLLEVNPILSHRATGRHWHSLNSFLTGLGLAG